MDFDWYEVMDQKWFELKIKGQQNNVQPEQITLDETILFCFGRFSNWLDLCFKCLMVICQLISNYNTKNHQKRTPK